MPENSEYAIWVKKENDLLKKILATAKEVVRIARTHPCRIDPTLAAQFTGDILGFSILRLRPKLETVEKNVRLENDNRELFPIFVKGLIFATQFQQVLGGQRQEIDADMYKEIGQVIKVYEKSEGRNVRNGG